MINISNYSNMKSINFIFVLGIIVLSSCSTTLKTINSGKQIDSRLIGVWVGSEKDKQIEGVEKKWVMTRRDDGTFTLDFTYTQNGKSQTIVENGNWWIENGRFYEYHDVSGNTDIYKYEVLDSDHIKFISKNMSVDIASESYEFIDTRKK